MSDRRGGLDEANTNIDAATTTARVIVGTNISRSPTGSTIWRALVGEQEYIACAAIINHEATAIDTTQQDGWTKPKGALRLMGATSAERTYEFSSIDGQARPSQRARSTRHGRVAAMLQYERGVLAFG